MSELEKQISFSLCDPSKNGHVAGFPCEGRGRDGYVMNNPRATVKVTADVMTRCRSVQRKTVLHVRAIKGAFPSMCCYSPSLHLPPAPGERFCSNTEAWLLRQWPWERG